ncbi:MAG: alpha/beta fold hydrolase [Halobacteriaceae archaeon]
MADWWTTDRVAANGVELCHHRTGPRDARTVVLAHGFTDDGRCWTPLARELRESYDVVAYDARGHGRSDAPEHGYGVADRVADLVGVLDALDLEAATLVGHSMGGSTVANAAARHPERVRAAVLEDPAGMLEAGGAPAEERAREVREQVRAWREASREELLAENEARGPELAALLADARERVSPEVANLFGEGWPDARAVYPDVTVPALVLKADADEAGREADREVAGLLPEGRLVHVDGAGHCVRRDEFDAYLAELRAFLDDH